MPLSGCKEPEIVARQSGEPTAGAPIKKRWLHLLRPQSPQTSSIPSANDLQQKEQPESSTKAAASGISDGDAIIVTSPVENRDNCADRNIDVVQGKISPLELNLQEQSGTVGSSSGSDIDGGKLEVAEKNTLQSVAENIHVELAPSEVLVNKQQEIQSEKNIRKEDLETRQVSTELLLATVEPMALHVAGQNNSRSQEEEEKLNPQLWDLGLNKGSSDSKTGSADGELKSSLCASRSNWDLNTTMERWDNLDAFNGSSVIDDPNASESRDDMPMICSSEKVLRGTENTLVDQCKQVVVKSKQAAQFFDFRPAFQQQTRAEELLHLSLNTASTFSLGSIQRSSSSSSNLNLSSISNLNSSERQEFHFDNKSISASNPVKSEPSDVISKKDTTEAKAGNEKAKAGIVKSEPLDNYLQDAGRSSNLSNFGSTGRGAVKVEPVGVFNQEIVLPACGTLWKSELFSKGMRNTPVNGDEVPCSDSSVCPTSAASMSHELPTTKLGLSNCAVASCHSDVPTCTSATPPCEDVALAATENVGTVGSSLVSESLSPTKNPIVDRNILNGMEGVGVVSSEPSRLSVDASADLNGNGEGAESGEEKISFSDDMHDECSSASDFERNGDQAVDGMNSKDKHHDGEEDDYEDGEVREPLAKSSSKGVVFKDPQSEQVRHGDEDCSDMDISGCSGSDHAAALLQIEDKEAKSEDHAQSIVSYGTGDCEKPDQNGTLVPCSVESLPNEVLPTAAGTKKSIKYIRRKPIDSFGKEADPKVCDAKLLSEELGTASQVAVTGNDQSGNMSEQDNVGDAKANITLLSKVEAVSSHVELTKDVNNGRGNRSRIINLPRASNGLSSFGRKFIPGSRFLSSRTERERNVDDAGYENKLLPRGSRDDNLIDGAQKLERQRNQDQPVRGTGTGFVHGRRFDKHLESSRSWESDCNFTPDNFNGASGFQFSRSKNTSGVSPAKVESNGLFVPRDATIVGGGRGGRKQLNDESPTFRHPSRRRSPIVREVHISHGGQIRRPPRDSSTERCLVGGGPDVGLRHEEKFIRGPPEGMIDPMFSRHQPRYRRVGDPFVRRDRSFSPIQGRGPLHVARIRSKSPPVSRTRSPGPWSSPRRRSSPDTFGQHELVHRRTSPFYRIRRMRSPNQAPCFPEDMVARRLGSPPYMAELPSDIREHDSPRFLHRSPSGRVLPRNSRRFEIMEGHREEIDREQYFGEHMPSGRFHELRGDEVADDRRILEGRGVVRSFRPPLIGSDLENFQFHEGGHRPFRFSPGADAEFRERSNLRVRDFERHVKNRPDNAPRRTRNIEEQEENFRHGEQEWHDASFEDVARPKRRRF
ncbi:hypothetical protein Syun_015986 [Stephania yunnanensis]|uniref:Uncharacterized protein n=1 Tax=Stephania yunnanensis TaxID=152371 RepID=A0AAP0J4B3_9MAGN